jgi:UDP-glucose 4-epimerase
LIITHQGKKNNQIADKRVKYINSNTKNISKSLNKYKKNINSLFHFGEFARIFQSFLKLNECINSNTIGTHEVFNLFIQQHLQALAIMVMIRIYHHMRLQKQKI